MDVWWHQSKVGRPTHGGPKISFAPPRIYDSSQNGGRGGGPTKPGRPTWQWWPHQLTFSLITLLKFYCLCLSYLVEIKKMHFLSMHEIEKQNLNAENKYEITTDIPGQQRALCFRFIEQDLSVGFHSVDASVSPRDGDCAGISFSRHSLECSTCLAGSSFCSAFLADLPLLYL